MLQIVVVYDRHVSAQERFLEVAVIEKHRTGWGSEVGWQPSFELVRERDEVRELTLGVGREITMNSAD